MEDYSDKSRFNRFTPTIVTHRNKTIRDVTSVIEYNKFINAIRDGNYRIAIIPNYAAGRPDLLSTAAYDTPAYWWVIMIANNITDASNELTIGKQIKIPNI